MELTALERIRRLVDSLTKDREERVWTGDTLTQVLRSPLIEDLRLAIHGDLGSSGGGRSALAHMRSVIDVNAFEMYEDITGRIDSFYNALTGKPPRETAEETLQAWYVAYRAFSMSGKYTDAQENRVEAQLKRFIHRIEAYLDPPRVKEIEGECPVETCGKANVKSKEGGAQTALYAAYRTGEEPYLKCRACGAEWVGERLLLEMGYYLKATVDEEALRGMGVLK